MSDQQPRPEFQIQKVYLKDLSFLIPNSDEVWTASWSPELHTDFRVDAISLPEQDTYESVLTLEIRVRNEDIVAFEIEIKQAGIFTVKNMSEDQVEHAKQVFCPNILYHYARETVSNLVVSGGFPQLCLSAIDFDAVYQKSIDNKHDCKSAKV